MYYSKEVLDKIPLADRNVNINLIYQRMLEGCAKAKKDFIKVRRKYNRR